jgi:hypothetical protein
VNDIQQEKLATHMEITGVPKTAIDQRQQDLTALAREIITSFGVTIEPSAVQHAFARTIEKIDKSIIVVLFRSVEEKARIMRTKRESMDKRPIFFDHRLTQTNRVLFSAARKAARESGGKAFVNRGRVFIVKDTNKMRVFSPNDIETFMASLRAPTDSAITNNNTAHQPSTSS